MSSLGQGTRSHPLEHRIPPPVVGLLVAVAMWAASLLPPALPIPPGLRMPAALLLALAALVCDVGGIVAFRRARTTVNPLRPDRASALVTGGIYRFTRNPMYLGLVLLLAGWAVWLAALWPFAGPVFFVLYIGRFQIAPEERMLRQRFGAEFGEYAARVRRWL